MLSLNQIFSSTARPEASESLTRTRLVVRPVERKNPTTIL
jgi:hypothetical protein